MKLHTSEIFPEISRYHPAQMPDTANLLKIIPSFPKKRNLSPLPLALPQTAL
jgi:hypothetical protein